MEYGPRYRAMATCYVPMEWNGAAGWAAWAGEERQRSPSLLHSLVSTQRRQAPGSGSETRDITVTQNQLIGPLPEVRWSGLEPRDDPRLATHCSASPSSVRCSQPKTPGPLPRAAHHSPARRRTHQPWPWPWRHPIPSHPVPHHPSHMPCPQSLHHCHLVAEMQFLSGNICSLCFLCSLVRQHIAPFLQWPCVAFPVG